MEKKALYIFYYYGEGYAAGIQNKRFIKGIKHNHLNYDVIFRYSMSKNNEEARQIMAPELKILNKIISFFSPGLASVVKIDEVFWTLKVILKIKNEIKQIHFIHITSSPFFVQVIGLFFKFKKRTMWFAQLLDPISDNFYLNKRLISRYVLKSLEKIIVRNADLVLTNNCKLNSILLNRYHLEKIKFRNIPLVTDDSIVPTQKKNEIFTIVYSGGIYGHRNLNFLINSINIFNYKYGIEDSFIIEIIGNCEKNQKIKVSLKGLENKIRFYDYMSKDNLYLRLSKADAFLVIDSQDHDGVFFPSKLCEYFSFQKLILAITKENSITNEILKEAKHLCYFNGDEERFADELNCLIINKECYNNFDPEFYKNFLPDLVAKQYLDTISVFVK
jgi:glycosyltransferase involved in cell wall biosynthesis